MTVRLSPLVILAGALWPAFAHAQYVGGPASTIASGDSPALAVSGAGTFIAAWQAPPGSPSAIEAAILDASGQPSSPPFEVWTGSGSLLRRPAVAANAAGNFVVVWQQSVPGLYGTHILGRRFDATGAPLGTAFRVDTQTSGSHVDAAVASDAAGNMVVVWSASGQEDGPGATGIFGQRFDAGGSPVGGEFHVNTYTIEHQLLPAVSFDGSGGFVVAWQSRGQDGSDDGIYARRYDAAGVPASGEFAVNTITTGAQGVPAVAALANGGFVIAWLSQGTPGGPGVFARQYDAAGSARGAEYRVAATAVQMSQHTVAVAAEPGGGYAVGWAGGPDAVDRACPLVMRYDADGRAGVAQPAIRSGAQDGARSFVAAANSGTLLAIWRERLDSHVLSRRFGPVWPRQLQIRNDGNHNGVLEPGETATVAPEYVDARTLSQPLAGTARSFTGPGGAPNAYVIADAQATYQPPPGAQGPLACTESNDCYGVAVSLSDPRPALHVDGSLTEDLATAAGDARRTWRIHVGGSFADVPPDSPFYGPVETLLHHGITEGCGPSYSRRRLFCPQAVVTRGDAAVLLAAAVAGPDSRFHTPPPFIDVPAESPFASAVMTLLVRGIIEGCSVDRLFCPDDAVRRADAAVWLLRSFEDADYLPPTCVTPLFSDVPCESRFAPWINELARRGVTSGCGGGRYCPDRSILRQEMAVLITRTFGLPLYGGTEEPPGF